MPIQLDKILLDVANEKVLHPYYPDTIPRKEIENAWLRVGKKNSLSVHEVRSIYKVLQKKYEQEKLKEHSGWKLFPIMDEIHKTSKSDVAEEEPLALEEDEEYEMLEVQEEDEQPPQQQGNTSCPASDTESPSKSGKSDRSPSRSPENHDKQPKIIAKLTTTISPREEKKLLNSMVTPNSRINSSTAAALQKKGITMKKTTPNGSSNRIMPIQSPQQSKTVSSSGHQLITIGKTIQLPEALKRKLSEDQASAPLTKKPHTQAANHHHQSPQKAHQTQTTKTNIQVIDGREEKTTTSSKSSNSSQNGATSGGAAGNPIISHHGINIITIPASDGSSTICVNGSTNAMNSDENNGGSSPQTEEIDYRTDIIFDASVSGDNISVNGNGNGNGQVLKASGKPDSRNDEKHLELGVSDSVLTRNFFKNLCNSTRYESFGLYVANAMNRFDPRTASRVEVKILRAIIDAQNETIGDS